MSVEMDMHAFNLQMLAGNIGDKDWADLLMYAANRLGAFADDNAELAEWRAMYGAFCRIPVVGRSKELWPNNWRQEVAHVALALNGSNAPIEVTEAMIDAALEAYEGYDEGDVAPVRPAMRAALETVMFALAFANKHAGAIAPSQCGTCGQRSDDAGTITIACNDGWHAR